MMMTTMLMKNNCVKILSFYCFYDLIYYFCTTEKGYKEVGEEKSENFN